MEDRVSIHFSVEDGIIEVEQKKGPLISRKEISRDQLLNCFRKSVYIREDAPPVLSSGFLPLNTLAVRQTKESVSVVVWYPASVRICRCIKRLIRISRSPALSSVFQSGPQTAL